MRRVLFHWRGITIWSYPAFLYLGIVCGVIAGTLAGRSHGLDPLRLQAALLLLVLPALVGARLLYVVSHWRLFRTDPARIWRSSEGGAAMYGGLLLAFVVSLPLLRALGLPVGSFWDAATITMLTGMIFARIGCLLNGCCAGRPSDGRLAMRLPDVHGVWRKRLPTQLFEAALGAALLAGSAWLWDRLPFGGALFLANVAVYGALRLPLESMRESIDRIGKVSVQHAISAGLCALAAGVFIAAWWQKAVAP